MQNGEISWAKFFSHIDCWCKKARETSYIFSVHNINSKKLTVHFNYVPSVLELELCMGLKCTWCFVTMNFEFIFIYIDFSKHFAIKSKQNHVYCYPYPIYIVPLLSGHFSESRGWPLNRGRTVVWKQHTTFFNQARDDSKKIGCHKSVLCTKRENWHYLMHNCYRPLWREFGIARMNLNSERIVSCWQW